MTKELLISSSPHETKVAVLEDDQLVEVYFQRDLDSGLVGGIYKGRVNRVLPGMQSAFVDIGLERDAFLYVSDFFEDSEEYDRVFTEAENRVARATGGALSGVAPAAIELPRVEVVDEPAPLIASGPQPNSEAPEAVGAPAFLDSRREQAPAWAGPANADSQAAPTEAAAGPDPSAEPKKDERAEIRQREFPRHDSPGRRHRRRGRSFHENRFGSRREGEKPHDQHGETASKPLELLPGESLAKYSQGASEHHAEGPESFGMSSPEAQDVARLAGKPDGNPEEGRADLPWLTTAGTDDFNHLAPEANQAVQISTPTEIAAPSSAIGNTIEEGDTGAPGFSGESQPTGMISDLTLSAAEEKRIEQHGAASGELAEGPEAEGSEEQDEAFDEESEFSFASSAIESENADQFSSSRNIEDQSAARTNGEMTAQPGEAAESPSGQTYTLRDSHSRARVAPRRGRKGGRGRFRGPHGRKPETGSAGRPRSGNHQPLPINELLKEGQEILVQIAKEPLGAKGARITSHIALPGRYLVYMPTITHIGVSRKIGSDEERLRLRNIILENRGSLTGGFIVRTAGAGRSEEELKADLAFLTNLWNDIRTRAERSKAPALLHRDLTLVERILRDLLSPDFKCVRADNEMEYEHVLDFVNRFQPGLVGHVKLYTRDAPLFEEFGVQAEIDKALKPKVWLKSGGYIVINQTEALVAIDVNTGKYVGKTNRLEDTIVKTNIDAVMEIVRQIRLRDLGGIIVIDFIDMDERRNRTKVVQALEDALRRDRAPTKILSFNEFGLVALTRKRAKQSLERTLCDPCPYCSGAGWVKSVATVSNEIVAEARKMAAQIDGKSMTLRVHPQVAASLKSKDGVLLSEIEASSRKEVVIKSDPTVQQERFEIF
ncbi:MAG: Rne/Rng family ribonuclease [Terriglobia bacterium]